MLPVLRRDEIKEIIQDRKSVSVSFLAEKFEVTEETIRRDLKMLEDEGVLKRIYGGAYIDDMVKGDVDITLRENTLVKEKERIAEVCAKKIVTGNSIFLDASTTSLYIALKIKDMRITVITNSLKIANILSQNDGIHLIIIGGEYESNSMSQIGKAAENMLSNLFVDKAFVSCRSVHIRTGITDSNEQQAEIRKLAILHANEAYLVVDHTKFGYTSFSYIDDFKNIYSVVTDKKLSNEWKEFLKVNDILIEEAV